MSKLKLLSTIAASIILAGTASKVFAGNEAGSFSITPEVGGYMFDDNQAVHNMAMPSLSLGYDFTDNWGFEALYGHGESRSTGIYNQHATANLVQLDGLYHFTTGYNLEPFLMAGVGSLDLSPNGNVSAVNYNGNTAQTLMNVNAGAGIQIFLNDALAFRADARDIYMTTSGGKNDFLLNAGFTYLIGANKHLIMADPAPVNPCLGMQAMVVFANNSAVLNGNNNIGQLNKIAACMRNYPGNVADISAYSNSPTQRNMILAKQRATTIADYMHNQGEISQDQLNLSAFVQQPPVPNSVEVQIVPAGPAFS
jgi:outer membrane protein OmpA-like peptidoglycan-associated protein